MLEKIKNALQLSTNDFDSELMDLLSASIIDLNLSGVDASTINADTTDAIVIRAIITYCCYQFELVHGDSKRAEALKGAYDEQKKMLGMSTGYTNWGD